MIQAGFVHTEGRYVGQPNVRRFAIHMAAMDNGDREIAERNIRRWIDEKHPTSPTLKMRVRLAEVLTEHGRPTDPDELRLKPAIEALAQRRQESDAVAERVLAVLESLERRVQALERAVLGEEDETRSP